MQTLRLTVIFIVVFSPGAISFAKCLGDLLPYEPLSHQPCETSLTSVFDHLFVFPQKVTQELSSHVVQSFCNLLLCSRLHEDSSCRGRHGHLLGVPWELLGGLVWFSSHHLLLLKVPTESLWARLVSKAWELEMWPNPLFQRDVIKVSTGGADQAQQEVTRDSDDS